MAQEDAAIRDIWIASEGEFVPSLTEVSEVRRDMGKMRPAWQKQRSPRGLDGVISFTVYGGCWPVGRSSLVIALWFLGWYY